MSSKKPRSLWTEWSVSLSGKDGLLFVKLPPKSHTALQTGLINTCFQLGDFLIKLLSGGKKKYINKKKKPRTSSRRRCSQIRKPLNRGSRTHSVARGIVCLHLSGPSMIISTGAANWKRASEMRLLAAIIIYYSQLEESWESFVFISVNSNYVCD